MARKSIVQFTDVSDEVVSPSEAPIIGKQTPRRPLLATSVALTTPGARSTPFISSVISLDNGKEDLVERRIGMKRRRLKKSETTQPSKVPFYALALSSTLRYHI